ncbi:MULTISPECIES: hypothetical protein [Pseudoalteromonas]|uniref:DUF3011 domain-containing protein n=1 Tax=Pseudoalteromonas piscicida TaxID=43662 RepID=A0ABM6NKP8_PSEO7|nr:MULTISPECIES: hypothetical protein [Pseudoalteromonas]ATD09125.1 hypothetical protein PPIS_a4505 [Pseudoalteromonas piscicida]MCO7198375.1 hypothetical protein [Pseudoalteromonas sp. OANN1]WPU31089.1 hypothetical protein SIO17_18750 [Pseudoalteromonas piscicida]
MKNFYLSVLGTTLLACSSVSEARIDCPGGQGYWDYQTRQVQVCDTETRTVETTKRHCSYGGVTWLGHLWHEPDFPLPMTSYETGLRIIEQSNTCPSSVYTSRTGTYWYTDPEGRRWISNYTYSGNIGLTNNKLVTTTSTETIKTNCRTETQTVRVWRCGMIP